MVTENMIEDEKLTRKQVCSEIDERVEDASFWSTVVFCVENWLFGRKVLILTTENTQNSKDQWNFECRIQNLKPRF
jgi:hypothetical protein